MDDKTIGERGKTEPAGSGSSQPTGDAVSSRRFAISATARCERCGGTHTLRQRCPADIEPAAETAIISAPSSPATATVAAPSAPTTYTPAGVRHRYEFASAAGRIDGSVAPPALRTLRRDAPPQHRGFARSSAKWAGAIVGTITLLSCFAVATTYIVNLTQVDQDPAKALAAIFVSLGVGIVFGMALMFISMKTYSKFVFAGLAPVLVTGGFVMLVFAPVVRQMNTPELAEYQAFSDLLWFGALSLVLGVALSAVCLRWALRPHAIRRIARWARILGSAYGVMLGISGVFAIFGLFRLINAEATYSNGSEQSVVEQAISIAAIAMWSFVPGLILTYQGISASMGEGSNEYRPPVAAYGFLLFAGVLVAGQLNMRSDDPIAAPMPLLHVAAAALPGLTFAAMAARGSALRGAPVRSVTWRQFTLAVAISMAIATSIAIYVESLGSLAGVVLLLVHNGAFADAQSQSLAALEMLVHLDSSELLQKYVLIGVEFDQSLIRPVDPSALPKHWRSDPPPPEARSIGDEWVFAGSSAVLQVPSALVPGENNFLLNPGHKDFARFCFGKPLAFASILVCRGKAPRCTICDAALKAPLFHGAV